MKVLGCLFLLVLLAVVVVWVYFGGFTKLQLIQIWEMWTDDCAGADELVTMSYMAVGGARRQWSEDPCGDLPDVECQIRLLKSSISIGCVSNTGADCVLGRVLTEQGRYDESIDYLSTCVSRGDYSASIWYLAHSYHQLGRTSEADATKERLIAVRKRYPNDAADDHLPEDPFVEDRTPPPRQIR